MFDIHGCSILKWSNFGSFRGLQAKEIPRYQQGYSRRWGSWYQANKHGNCKSPFYLEIHLQMCTRCSYACFRGYPAARFIGCAMSHLLRPHFVDEIPITTDRLDPTSPFLDVVLIDQEGRLTGCAWLLEMCHITCRILPCQKKPSLAA
jgi:hypothetical protein